MNDLIINCIVISLSISLSNLVVQYIIEVYIRKTTYVTMAEFELQMKLLKTTVAAI